ncbi:MAG: NAD-dependent epimerase/dehydratase family protein [Deltaproteobacteria bacterium]|nr:NAD-dependent epimerase/dehydratase family protein [Deltaproteobacteria bacterium]
MDISKAYKEKNILITGGMGFIGSNLTHRLVGLGARVTIVDSLIPHYGGNLFNIKGIEDKVSVNISDVRDPNAMRYLVKEKDYLFNLAGQVSHTDSMSDPMTDLDINCTSQLSILEACRHNNPSIKIVFAATRQEYGRPDYLPVDEKHPLKPADVNGINKMAGEWYHLLYNNVYGIRTVSLRLTNTYGPRQLMKHNRQGFVYWFVRLAVEGKEIPIFGDGLQKRDFTYVDDAVTAFLLSGASEKADGCIFNLGGERPYTLLEFTEILLGLCKGAEYRIVPFPEDKKKIDIGDFYADCSKIKTTLGWEPRVALDAGLKMTVEYFKKNLAHYI